MDGLVFFRGQLESMFGNSDPTQSSILHALEFADCCRNFFAVILVFIRQVDFFFPDLCQPFAVCLHDRAVLFHLGVPAVALFILDSRDEILFIVHASAGMSLLLFSS